MSYPKPNTGDPELDRKWIEEDFAMLSPKLLKDYDDPVYDQQYFVVWLEKLMQIDRGLTAEFIRKNHAAFPPLYIRIAKWHLRSLEDLPD